MKTSVVKEYISKKKKKIKKSFEYTFLDKFRPAENALQGYSRIYEILTE